MRDKISELNRENLDEFIQQEVLMQKEVRKSMDIMLEEINIENIDIEKVMKKGENPFYRFKEFLNKEIEISTSLVAGVLIIILTSSLIINIGSIKVNAQEIRNSEIKVVNLGGDNHEKNKN